jgi:hypothetical protein
LVDRGWQIAIRPQKLTDERSHNLLVGWAETQVAIACALEFKENVNGLPPSCTVPNITRLEGREENFLAANAVHFFADDIFDSRQRP